MSGRSHRIVGPNENRLLAVVDLDKDLMRPGLCSAKTAEHLIAAGWREYHGPATTRGGWVVPGSDPALRPRQLKRT